MGLHEKAWSGLNLVIYGKTPLLPMKLEQILAGASPANEVRLNSFEDYDQAYDFCKDVKNVGFIVVLENCGPLKPSDVFRELAKHYEKKGWPCFGVLVSEKEKTVSGYAALTENKNWIGYFRLDEVTAQPGPYVFLSDIWKTFVSKFEEQLFPLALQSTFLSLISETYGLDRHLFVNRLANLFEAKFSLTWIECLGLRWLGIIDSLAIHHSKALEPHEVLAQIHEMISTKGVFSNPTDVMTIAQSKAPLAKRLAATFQFLDAQRLNGRLKAALAEIEKQSKPGASAIIQHMSAHASSILEIADQVQGDAKSVGGKAA